MLDTTDRDDTGPWQCSHCGSRFVAPLMFCPQCGTHQLAASSAAPDFEPDASPRGFAARMRAHLDARRAAREHSTRYDDDGYASIAYDPIDEERELRRSRQPLYVGGTLAMIAFAVAAYLMMPGNEAGSMRRGQTIEGVVGGMHRNSLDDDAPPAPSDIDIAGLNVPSDPNTPGTGIDIAGLNVASAPSLREAVPGSPQAPQRLQGAAIAPTPSANARTVVTKQLAIARADLDRNSLWPARRAIANALSAQPDNADALRMRTELAAREQERDALLAHARQCARSRQWSCSRQYAERAAGVDMSSRDAKRLLVRGPSHRRETVVARHSDPNLLDRLHRWFEQSIAQSAARPTRQSPWGRDQP
jgi:hypothetical protein